MNQAPHSEIVFRVECDPDGGFIARAEGESIFTHGSSLGHLKARTREAVLTHFEADRLPARIRIQFVTEAVFPTVEGPDPARARMGSRRFRAGWIAWALVLVPVILLIGAGCWVLWAIVHTPEDLSARLGLSALAVAYWVCAWLLCRVVIRPEIRVDDSGITQRFPFRSEIHLAWEEVMAVTPGTGDAWLFVSDGGSRAIYLPSSMAGTKLKAIGSILLECCPPEVWELNPESRRWIQDQVLGQVPLTQRPLF